MQVLKVRSAFTTDAVSEDGVSGFRMPYQAGFSAISECIASVRPYAVDTLPWAIVTDADWNLEQNHANVRYLRPTGCPRLVAVVAGSITRKSKNRAGFQRHLVHMPGHTVVFWSY